jgi:hypothetical protein
MPRNGRFHLDPHANNIANNVADGDPDELLPDDYVGRKCHVTTDTLQSWRSKGIGPPFRKVGPRLVRYPRGLLVKWLRSRARAEAE